MSQVTQILTNIESGEVLASDELLPLVYDELRKIAKAKLCHEKPGQTLQATALVHEAFVRLVDAENKQKWENLRHFFAAAAEAMRRILIEKARQKQSQKRGGNHERVELSPEIEPSFLPLVCDDILGLDEAINKLADTHPRKAELVKLPFFAGLTVAQAASALEISTTTAENDWVYARSWLRVELRDEP